MIQQMRVICPDFSNTFCISRRLSTLGRSTVIRAVSSSDGNRKMVGFSASLESLYRVFS